MKESNTSILTQTPNGVDVLVEPTNDLTEHTAYNLMHAGPNNPPKVTPKEPAIWYYISCRLVPKKDSKTLILILIKVDFLA